MTFRSDWIVLTRGEVKLATYVGTCRERAHPPGSNPLFTGERNGFESHIEGAAAELAFCRLFNVYPDLDEKVKDVDATLPHGLRVDVKCTKYVDNGRLAVELWKQPGTVDVYALMVGEMPNFRYVGAIEAPRVLVPERIGLLPNRTEGDECYIVERRELDYELHGAQAHLL